MEITVDAPKCGCTTILAHDQGPDGVWVPLLGIKGLDCGQVPNRSKNKYMFIKWGPSRILSVASINPICEIKIGVTPGGVLPPDLFCKYLNENTCPKQ